MGAAGKSNLIKLLPAVVGFILLTSLAVVTEGNDVIKTSKKRSTDDGGSLHVAAFNIQSFGKSKMRKTSVARHIVRILERYDVVLIQEVKDKGQTSIIKLWRLLNTTTGEDWGMVKSGRLGKSSRYKEQYVFFYRLQAARLAGSYQVPESRLYAREPFSVQLDYDSYCENDHDYFYYDGSHCEQTVVLMGLHAQPDQAVSELTQLATSIRKVARVFPHADGVVAMGDFNADCSYASEDEREDLEIFSSRHFRSLIPDTADTTSGRSDCAYDRVVVYGSDVMVRDAQVYNFREDLGLSAKVAAKVSDHYPVEFKLY